MKDSREVISLLQMINDLDCIDVDEYKNIVKMMTDTLKVYVTYEHIIANIQIRKAIDNINENQQETNHKVKDLR